MNKKYELTTETKEIDGHTVYRIKALKSFDTFIRRRINAKEINGHKFYRIKALKSFDTFICRRVNAGDLGGWVESEKNLSQDGHCWLFDDAAVYGNSRRSGNSAGHENSQQSGNSRHITGCDNGSKRPMTGSRFRVEERSGIVAVYDTTHPEYRDTPGCHADYPWTVCSWHGAHDDKAGHWNVDQRWIDKARAACELLNTLSANATAHVRDRSEAEGT